MTKTCMAAHRMRLSEVKASAVDDLLEAEAGSPPKRQLSFVQKLVAAFKIFFPAGEEPAGNARVDAKNRLKMILVADRCSMSPQSVSDMKDSIVTAISNYVEVDDGNTVDLEISNHPDMGTIYSVTVPVKRVKSNYEPFEIELGNEGLEVVIENRGDIEPSTEDTEDIEPTSS
eukprot:gene22171-26725_t